MKQYDLIIIGGGPAGLVASRVAVNLGKTVAIIEKEKLGGDCTWTGCVPSKALIHIANTIASEKQAQCFLTDSLSDQDVDTLKVMQHVRNKINEIYQKDDAPEIIAKEGIDILVGSAQFVDSSIVEVNNERFQARKIIIATGTRPFIPQIDGLQAVQYLTNETIFQLKTLPKSMIILGGGPIGVEMACALNKLGIKITILEERNAILSHEDSELDSMLEQRMRSQGIEIKTSIKIVEVVGKDGVKCIGVQSDGTRMEFAAEQLLVAIGRSSNIENLNLEKIGVETTTKSIKVNSKLQTSVSHIYAAGDAVGPYQFTHMAGFQAAVAVQNAFIPFFKKHMKYDNIIWVTFSDPEFASCGLNELQAREKYGNNIKVFKKTYKDIDRAKIENKTFGLCKLICDNKGYILGAQILGERAGELIHEIQLAKINNIKIWNIIKTLHAYPTYSELIWQIGKDAYVQHMSKNILVKLASFLFRIKT